MTPNLKVSFRSAVRDSDAEEVRAIVQSTGFFAAAEVEVAVELVTERLARGEVSGYHFLFAESERRTVGYTCFGPIACTVASFDLYWIAVGHAFRGRGLGKLLLEASEQAIRDQGGVRVYIETSSRPQYEPTRGFYATCGYREEAVLEDFYAPGDGKVIYLKVLASPGGERPL